VPQCATRDFKDIFIASSLGNRLRVLSLGKKRAWTRDTVLVSRKSMRLAFDDFIFDEEQYELRRADTVVKIDAKLLKLLTYLLKHSGKLVSKQELLTEVWEGRALSNNILSVSVAKLRKALGHKTGEREYIVNTFGLGYRFTPAVTVIESDRDETVSTSRPPEDSTGTEPLVGRGSVMQRLDVALARSRAGNGSICMLVGEPGIGKTRAAQALEERASASGALWAWARCHSMEGEPPLWLWTQILREYLHTGFGHEIRQILDERINEEDKENRAIVLTHLAWIPPNCMNARRVHELLTRAEALARESRGSSALSTVLQSFTGVNAY
jgi:DNA-binding winged helix-turn-helix (wHTH) protein